MTAKRWDQIHERSTPFMLVLLLRCAMFLGRRGLRPVVYLTVAYFVLTSSAARRHSRDYLRRVLPRPPTLLDVCRHFLSFANCSIDRFFLLSGKHSGLRLSIDRPADVLATSQSGRGCLLLAAHFGSFEVLRLLGAERTLPIKILLDRHIGRMLTALFERISPGFAATILDGSQRGPQLVLALKETLERNGMVGVMGDRLRAGEPSVVVDFLGGKAHLPAGPWRLAAALNAPVILGFGTYLGGNQYQARFELLANRIELPRAHREQVLQDWAQRYADRLADHLRASPYNWFNFYDFWQPQ